MRARALALQQARLTSLPVYQRSTLWGRRTTNKHLHAACGLCLTLPVPPSLLRSWGDDPVYIDAMPTSVTTSSCPFFAAVGILPGVNTIGVGADNPSMDGAGRFITYT